MKTIFYLFVGIVDFVVDQLAELEFRTKKQFQKIWDEIIRCR